MVGFINALVESIDKVVQRRVPFAKRLGAFHCLLGWPGCGHWDSLGDESLAGVGIVAAPARVVLAMIVVYPKEIENAKMVVVERIVDEELLLHLGPLHWPSGEYDVGR